MEERGSVMETTARNGEQWLAPELQWGLPKRGPTLRRDDWTTATNNTTTFVTLLSTSSSSDWRSEIFLVHSDCSIPLGVMPRRSHVLVLRIRALSLIPMMTP